MSKSTTAPCPAKISEKSKECCQRAGCRFRYNDEKEICEPKCVGNDHMIDPDTCECSCDTQKWHTLLEPDGRTCKPCPQNTKLFFNPPRCVECKGQGSMNCISGPTIQLFGRRSVDGSLMKASGPNGTKSTNVRVIPKNLGQYWAKMESHVKLVLKSILWTN